MLDSLTNRLLRLDPIPWLAGNARGRRAIMMGDTAGEARFVAELREQPDQSAKMSAGLVAYTIGDLLAGRRLWRLIAEPHRSRGFRMTAHLTLAKFELTNGGWGAASTELAALGALDAGAALEHHAFFALTRFLKPARSELTGLRDSLRRWDPSSTREEGDGLIEVHRSAHPYFRLYLLGMLSARLGEPEAALGYAAELRSAGVAAVLGDLVPEVQQTVDERADLVAAGFAGDQGQFVRAEVAWKGGRREEALALLDQARYWTTDSRRTEHGDSPFFNQLHERFAAPSCYTSLDVTRRPCHGTGPCPTISSTPPRPISGWPRSTSAGASDRRPASTTPASSSCGGTPTRRFSRWYSRRGRRWLGFGEPRPPLSLRITLRESGRGSVRRGRLEDAIGRRAHSSPCLARQLAHVERRTGSTKEPRMLTPGRDSNPRPGD